MTAFMLFSQLKNHKIVATYLLLDIYRLSFQSKSHETCMYERRLPTRRLRCLQKIRNINQTNVIVFFPHTAKLNERRIKMRNVLPRINLPG